MRISFRGFTNKDYCMVNNATFKLKNGVTVTIDRAATEYTIENGNISMEWLDCYLWEIDGINLFDEEAFLNNDALKLFEGAELVSLDLEDDADSDYMVKITGYSFS